MSLFVMLVNPGVGARGWRRPDVVAKLVEGLVEEERGRTFQDIASERDRLIVAIKATLPLPESPAA
jgi:hypothetical protein